MKQLLFLSVVLVSLVSCVNQRQKSNLTGRTDEVYFTPSDTRIKGGISNQSNRTTAPSAKPTTKNYASSYSDRIRNFGSSNRFSYNNYQPVLMPSLMYNNHTGWTLGLSYGSPMMGGYGSPFSPYYGYNMPYNNPFYAYGWGGGWMTNYYPCYTYNPYMFSYGNNGYGPYGGYNNYNPYNYNSYNNSNNNNNGYYNSGNSNYGRRTGNYSPSTQNNSNQRSEYKSPGNTNTNSNSNTSGGSGWWKTSSGSGSTSSGGGGGSRSGGNSSSNTSTRRR